MKIYTLWGWARHEEKPTLLAAEDEFTCDPDEWAHVSETKARGWGRAGYYDIFTRTIDVADRAILDGSQGTIVGAVVGYTSRPVAEHA